MPAPFEGLRGYSYAKLETRQRPATNETAVEPINNSGDEMRYEKHPFRDQAVLLDGNEFIECTFDRCELVFAGISPVTMHNPKMNGCGWTMTGPAALTINFMSGLYASGAHELIEQTFDNIRGKAARAGLKLN